MDGIGARLELVLRREDGSTYSLHRTLFGGSCFSAQNGFDVYFGLGEAVAIDTLVVRWPDGHRSEHTELSMDSAIVVHR
jgi:hypothetical protein